MRPLKRLSNSIFLWILLVSFSTLISHTVAKGAENTDSSKAPVYDSKGKRDPFEPLVSEGTPHSIEGLRGVQTADDLKIEGLVVDRVHGSYVVVNGVVLAEGKEQDGVKAVRIEETGTLFEIRGKQQFKKFSAMESEEVKN